MPYTVNKPTVSPSPDELRARIPGWGADLDHADRPAFPHERTDLDTGAHWELPEQQPDGVGREKSIEHERLTPVFGTAQPLRGVAGSIRRHAYNRYSEGQAAHWLLLILGDRVDAITAHLRSSLSRRPDDPITESGVLGERGHRPLASRFGRGRIDLKHAWLDPILVVSPWLIAGVIAAMLVGGVFARRR